MPYDAFLKLEGVEGESTRSGFEGQIEIESVDFGAENPTSMGPGSGRGSGKVSLRPISVTKLADSASTQLFTACCTGKHFPKAKLTFHRAGGDEAVDYLTWELEKVYISEYQVSGSSGMEERPREHINLTFGKIEITYTPQTDTGAKGSPKVASWDQMKVSK